MIDAVKGEDERFGIPKSPRLGKGGLFVRRTGDLEILNRLDLAVAHFV